MLDLNRTEIWKILDGPVSYMENLPKLISKLEETEDSNIMSEICGYYIYHQGSTYQATFVAIPHLVRICKGSKNQQFRTDILLSLSYVVGNLYDACFGHNVVDEGNFDKALAQELSVEFDKAFDELKELSFEIIEEVKSGIEEDKQYYLVLLAAVHKIFSISMLLIFTVDECETECPHCDGIFLLSKEGEEWRGYVHYPVFDKTQTPFIVRTKKMVEPSKEIRADNFEAWLQYYVNYIEFDSFKSALPYLFGSMTCPTCQKDYDIMPSLLSIYDRF